MMYLEIVYQNDNFVDGLPIYVFYNDIDGKYHCDLEKDNPTGILGVFNSTEIKNEIYVLTIIDTFCRMCQEAYERMVGE